MGRSWTKVVVGVGLGQRQFWLQIPSLQILIIDFKVLPTEVCACADHQASYIERKKVNLSVAR